MKEYASDRWRDISDRLLVTLAIKYPRSTSRNRGLHPITVFFIIINRDCPKQWVTSRNRGWSLVTLAGVRYLKTMAP